MVSFSRKPKEGWQKPVFSSEALDKGSQDNDDYVSYRVGVQTHTPSGKRKYLIDSRMQGSYGSKDASQPITDPGALNTNTLDWEIRKVLQAFAAGVETAEEKTSELVMEKPQRPLPSGISWHKDVTHAEKALPLEHGGWRHNWRLVADMTGKNPAVKAVALDDGLKETGKSFTLSFEGRKIRPSAAFDSIHDADEILPCARNMLRGIVIGRNMAAQKDAPEKKGFVANECVRRSSSDTNRDR